VNSEPNIQDSTGTELRARIVTAARECFRRFGFAKTSMQEIARASDMSAANLYRFYEGKMAIGAAVAAAEQAAMLAACDQAVTAAGPEPVDRLVALFESNIDLTRRKMKRTPLLFELGLTVAREKKELRRQFLEEIEARITAILAGGRPVDPFAPAAIKVRSRMILMASAPFVLPWMMQNEPFGDPRATVEPLVRALVSGFSVQTPAALPFNPSSN
jgi:AcrR family transcriptional regulator